MIIIREKVQDTGGCNFCNRGQLNKFGTGLIYPYEEVNIISSEGLTSVKMCDDCLKELKEITR